MAGKPAQNELSVLSGKAHQKQRHGVVCAAPAPVAPGGEALYQGAGEEGTASRQSLSASSAAAAPCRTSSPA